MRIIAFYLPQFHTIPENNKWWGEGFTEWTNVKKAKSLYKGHKQPRVPLNSNYYCLLDDNKTLKWQCKLAKEYGIYGFCFYHYWFNGTKLLEKPIENFLNDVSIEMPFCLCWANENWTNAWVSNENKVLIEQTYGDEKEWEEHYLYLKTFFHDKRYIKHNNKPLLVIYRPEIIPCMKEMMEYFKAKAIEDGFSGIEFAYQSISYDLTNYKEGLYFDYDIEYQPQYATTFMRTNIPYFLRSIYRLYKNILLKNKINIKETPNLKKYDYDKVWNYILKAPPISSISVPCGFVEYDNTPRKGKRGKIVGDFDINLFQENMCKLIKKTKDVYKKDFMFFFAWNEWGECGYLEPDEETEFSKLSSIKEALLLNNEFENINK